MENPAENAQETATDDLLLADSPEDDDPLLEEPAPARQGLPPGFRMRHDRHYVDELMGMRPAAAPRTKPRAAQPVAPQPSAAPREKADDTSRIVTAVMTAVAERLDIVRDHTAAGRRLTTRTSFDRALQVEIDRASRLAHAAVALAGELQIARRELTAGEIAERTKHATASLRQFSAVRWDLSVDDPGFRIGVDPNAVNHAVAGTLHAFNDMLDSAREADDSPVVRIKIHAVQPRPALMIEVSATGVAMSEDAITAFFDPAAGCHAAGAEGALLLSAAARIARAHGGRAEARRDGDAIVALFVFPRTA